MLFLSSFFNIYIVFLTNLISVEPDSNQRPPENFIHLQSGALPTELSTVKICEIPPRFELGLVDSKSTVLTVTPWDLLSFR